MTTLPDISALATRADLERLKSEFKAEIRAANRREDCGLSPALRTAITELKADIVISQARIATIVFVGLAFLLAMSTVIR